MKSIRFLEESCSACIGNFLLTDYMGDDRKSLWGCEGPGPTNILGGRAQPLNGLTNILGGRAQPLNGLTNIVSLTGVQNLHR